MENTLKKHFDNSSTIESLTQLIHVLRGDNGCPWDQKQTPKSISLYLIEEVFELVDAVDGGDPDAILEELGDVLFQILFIIAMFKEAGEFSLEDIIKKNMTKMVRRHPHVFGNGTAKTPDEVRKNWHKIKSSEKQKKSDSSTLDSIPQKLPALMRTYRVSERAAATGFDWVDIFEVFDKVKEEVNEFQAEIEKSESLDGTNRNITLELGDIFFTLVNVARFARVHPETALRDATHKFEKRFKIMEKLFFEKAGKSIDAASRLEMDKMWEEAKKKAMI